jgi:hypothetical protein
MDLREMGWDGMGLIALAQNREHWVALANTVMNLQRSINCWEIPKLPSDWRLLKKVTAPWSCIVNSNQFNSIQFNYYSTAQASANYKVSTTERNKQIYAKYKTRQFLTSG